MGMRVRDALAGGGGILRDGHIVVCKPGMIGMIGMRIVIDGPDMTGIGVSIGGLRMIGPGVVTGVTSVIFDRMIGILHM